MSIHTLIPNQSVPYGYFHKDNINFIFSKIMRVLKREYIQNISVDEASIIRVMERVAEERVEEVPKMNQRVIMYITNEFRVHQLQASKHLTYEEGFFNSQMMYNDLSNIVRFDPQNIKLANRLGESRVGNSSRFYFT